MDALLNATDAIVIIDNSGIVEFWNRGAQVMFGYESDEMIGNKLLKIIPKRHHKVHTEGLKKCSGA